jgi:hypothetical protein
MRGKQPLLEVGGPPDISLEEDGRAGERHKRGGPADRCKFAAARHDFFPSEARRRVSAAPLAQRLPKMVDARSTLSAGLREAASGDERP